MRSHVLWTNGVSCIFPFMLPPLAQVHGPDRVLCAQLQVGPQPKQSGGPGNGAPGGRRGAARGRSLSTNMEHCGASSRSLKLTSRQQDK
jgi:hypothetical protein